jgi:hypothetical protein
VTQHLAGYGVKVSSLLKTKMFVSRPFPELRNVIATPVTITTTLPGKANGKKSKVVPLPNKLSTVV